MKTIRLTRQNIHQLSGSPSGNGFTRKQIELLGLTWPPKKGWLSGIIGKEIPHALYEEIADAIRPRWAKKCDAQLGEVLLVGDNKFPRISFTDMYGKECHLEMSTIIKEEESPADIGGCAVWLGANEAPMHLGRRQVKALIASLTKWVDSARF